MGKQLDKLNAFLHHYGFYAVLHIFILLVSGYLVVCISIDTFKNIHFYDNPTFLMTQWWICLLFLGDFFIEFLLAPDKKRYMKSRWIFLIVSIPWLAIFSHFHVHFPIQVEYVIRYLPLVRGGYALAIVVGWFTSNRATSLFWSYLITLLATVYFSSLAFYLFEHNVNPLVKDYQSALWWAFMDVTTVGSNITAVTPVGRVLSVVLAALGMMMFPIFTVYVTDTVKRHTAHPSLSIFSLRNGSRVDQQQDESAKTSATPASDTPTASGVTNSSASAPKSTVNPGTSSSSAGTSDDSSTENSNS